MASIWAIPLQRDVRPVKSRFKEKRGLISRRPLFGCQLIKVRISIPDKVRRLPGFMAVCGFCLRQPKGNKIDRLRQGTHSMKFRNTRQESSEYGHTISGRVWKTHRNTPERTGGACMDLSPGFKRILVSLYIRYLPQDFWDWFKGPYLQKSYRFIVYLRLNVMRVGMRGIAAGKVKIIKA